jgi:hypothetical protein
MDIVGTEGRCIASHKIGMQYFIIGDERRIGTDILLVHAEQRPGRPAEVV